MAQLQAIVNPHNPHNPHSAWQSLNISEKK